MGREGHAHGVVAHALADGDAAHEALVGEDGVAIEDWLNFVLRAGGGARDDLAEVGARGVADLQLEEEAVELGLGQRVGAFLLDGVLRRHHEEGRFERVRCAIDGDAALLHGFEEGGLRLGRGAVDLVGEEDLREDRPVLELELAPVRRLDDDGGAGDIRGHQVGRELDAVARGTVDVAVE